MTDPRPTKRVLRGPLVRFLDDPGEDDRPAPGSLSYLRTVPFGSRTADKGRGPAIRSSRPTCPPASRWWTIRTSLMMPGFIDSHVHYVQLDILASYGRQLLDWLNDYTFPEECRFAERAHSEAVAEAFLNEQLRVGTTTAQVFCSSHPQSVDAFFAAAPTPGAADAGRQGADGSQRPLPHLPTPWPAAWPTAND